MGQKVSPIGMRVGVIRDWESRWYAEKDYSTLLNEDIKIRKYLDKACAKAKVSRTEIERTKNEVKVIIRCGAPGVMTTPDAKTNEPLVDSVKKQLTKIANGKSVKIDIIPVANPDLDARLVAMKIAEGLEQRQSFRTVQKKAIQATMRAGAKGIKTIVGGRLGGADIARAEGYSEGVVPLHTLRSDIDYAAVEAATTYGRLGVKVWICRGEVLPGQMVVEPEAPKNPMNRGPRRPRNDRRPARRDAAKPANATAAAPAAPAETPAKTDAPAAEGGN